jgi:hypothetical protein
MSTYKELFSIVINHSYYEDRRCRAITLPTTDETKAFFFNADIIMRESANKIIFLYNAEFTPALIAGTEDKISLNFIVSLTDLLFFNFTDIIQKKGYAFYLKPNLKTGSTDNYLLSKNEFISPDDLRPVTDSVFKGYIRKSGTISDSLGLIEINLTDIGFGKTGINHAPVCFTLNFNAKTTYWRYHVITKNNIRYDNLSIRDSLNKITFSKAKETILSNGQTSGQITSEQTIALNESANHHFSLYGTLDKTERLIIKNLSHPDIKHLNIEKNKNISEMYVYY